VAQSYYEDYGGKFYRLLHPRLTVIVASACPNGRVNLMPASWNTPISEDPPTIGVAVDGGSFTHECLEFSGEATINVPSSDMLNVVYSLGSVSGRDVDKVTAFGVRLVESARIKTPGIDGSLAIYEGRVVNKLEVGEVTFYVFEVLKTRVRRGVADEFGYDFSRVNVLLHGAGRVFHTVNPRKLWARKA